ncbi:MAG TPA: DNA topoisomerase 3 [Pyrinomonadaceae bacterium]|nr:DNA topoisomerase 3 [Pyrinomonadaceae bacterium]
MRLIITEKPSMGRDVAAALGATRRGEGYLEGKTDIITWCIGHLVELDDPEEYDPKFKSWRMETLPIIPEEFKYHASERTLDQFKVIKALLGRDDVTTVVNAADAGREGELIFDLVYTLARSRKPVERLWISSLTRDEIIAGFNRLKPAAEYTGLRDSARSRQQADWLVGLNATRAQTIKARGAGHDGVYSLGRVQTPTLALIVGRDEEIANFVPTNYYEVVADFESAAGAYRGTWFNKGGSRFDHKDAAEAVVFKVRGKPGAVEKVEKKATKERAPLLYDLTALQRAANARYSFSAARTLELAQTLYEKKFITYPRTSSRHLSAAVNQELKGHVEAAGVGPYVKFIETILKKGTPKLTSRHVDDKKVTDHHAVIPTKQRVEPNALAPDEKRIYDLVVRRFLAAFYPDAELERTTITTAVEGERFITRGTVVLKAGWREVDPPGREDRKRAEGDDEAEDAELPPVKALEAVETKNVEAVAKQTKAPPRYSESSLLGAMETAGKKVEDEELRLAMKDSGLGTPATRAAVIETLLKREYIVRDKKSLTATPKGIAVIKLLPSQLLKSAELTGSWEQKLARMARGEYARDAFMGEVKVMVTELVGQIAAAEMERAVAGEGGARRSAATTPRPEDASDCPKCKLEERAGFLVERVSASGKFLVCSEGRDVCGFISDAPKNAKQRKLMLATKCDACGSAMRLRAPREKGKRASLSCARYPECRGVRWFDEKGALEEAKAAPETGEPCKECGAPTIKRGPFKNESYFWGCTRWKSDKSGCNAAPVWINETRATAAGEGAASGASGIKVETGPPCPECETPTVKRGPSSAGSYFWSCPKWRSSGAGCNSKPIWINEARA